MIVAAAHRLIAAGDEQFTINELTAEAGIALQTFYRYFGGKDELLLAVIENLVAGSSEQFRALVADEADPVERLRRTVHIVLDSDGPAADVTAGRFIASEHWRLARLFPEEIASVAQPYVELLAEHIRAGCDAGTLRSVDPDRDAALIAELIRAVHNNQSFAGKADPTLADDVWRFCLAALGGD